MTTYFAELVKLCEKLEKTRKRLLMVDLVSEFLLELDEDEVEPATSMILGRALPKWDQKTLDVSWATLRETLGRITGVDWKTFLTTFNKTGDIGSTARALLEKRKRDKQLKLFKNKTLSTTEVRQTFKTLSEVTGGGSREKKRRIVEALLSSASPLEAKYLIRILVGEMRTGFHEGLMEQAVSKAFQIPLKTVQEAGMIIGDIAEVASLAKTGGVESLLKVKFKVFRPVNLMLAQTSVDVGEALEEHGGKTAFEYKLDGARVQIHKRKGEVKVFSRRLTDVTLSLPEIVDLVRKNLEVEEAILEGEVIAVDNRGRPIPFQNLMRRFKRIHQIEEMTKKIPVKLYLFDVLYLNEKSLISVPYMERRKILCETVGKIPVTKQIITDQMEKAKDFLEKSIAAGHEGLVAKNVNSAYSPGKRGKQWLKIKTILEPLDLVIVAAEYGHGRRYKWLSDYYLAAQDIETGDLLIIGKTFKGLKDEEIIEMTKQLQRLRTAEEGRKVIVVPKIVVEVLYNEIQKSSKYPCGMALRFARINRLRPDKTSREADTIQKVRRIFNNQFQKKSKYKT
ncbi:MAG: ATP-dependent DNA ligase [Candidatus Bathyarchaeota archaeon]|jgi:DNA ligase-1